jgi:DNA-binding GntR family transcriptional regulator
MVQKQPLSFIEQHSDPLGSRSLSLALRKEIEKLILGGGLSAGERLNENFFAEKFKVSRGPVREAFRALVEAGLLEFVPNRGVFIRQISLNEAMDAYEVRAALFGLAGRLAAGRLAPADIDGLRDLVARMDECIHRQDGPGYYRVNLDLHARILAATGNNRLVSTYRNLIKELHLVRAVNLDSNDHLEASNAEHRAMVEALAARDEDAASQTHFRHVMNAKERVLEVRDSFNKSKASQSEKGEERAGEAKLAFTNGKENAS